jgi:anti-anti-sigma factor
MEIKIENRPEITIATIVGSLDSAASPQAQEKLLPLASARSCLALDLSKCNYISSAGLRVLLMLAKQFSAQGSLLAMAGVCEEVKDVMEMTGFVNFFKLYDTVEEIVEVVRKES